eukprot:m.880739 g.880739  ORF g.880739 m.880739 type:complete len:75 (-) comp23593_c0_seq11:975-1199(-)
MLHEVTRSPVYQLHPSSVYMTKAMETCECVGQQWNSQGIRVKNTDKYELVVATLIVLYTLVLVAQQIQRKTADE